MTGNDLGYLVAREWALAAGRQFTSAELERGAKVAIIGQVLAEKLFDNRPRLGDSLRIGTVPFTLVGVLDKKGQNAAGGSRDDVVIIPLVARKSVSGYSKALKGVAISGWDSEMWNVADWTK